MTALALQSLVVKIRARDNPDVTILTGLWAGSKPEARELIHGLWRNGTFSGCVKPPLENIFANDEDVLHKRYG